MDVGVMIPTDEDREITLEGIQPPSKCTSRDCACLKFGSE